jgi:hypothetical protein
MISCGNKDGGTYRTAVADRDPRLGAISTVRGRAGFSLRSEPFGGHVPRSDFWVK